MKVRARDLTGKERMKTLDTLYTAAGSVRSRSAMKTFLKDLLTESERIMLGRRIQIARDILSGKPVDAIAKDMRVGYDTIYKVRRWLKDQLPGYEDAIAGMEKEFKVRKKKHEDAYLYATSGLYRLKKKYPLHFLLFPKPKKKPKK